MVVEVLPLQASTPSSVSLVADTLRLQLTNPDGILCLDSGAVIFPTSPSVLLKSKPGEALLRLSVPGLVFCLFPSLFILSLA